jgi:peptidoglycan hydrolase-like protein with peptidoglycan-binding domain
MTVRDVGQVRGDVRVWQTAMVAAGYRLTVDGQYGPQSAAAATNFEQSHGLHVESPGVVGPQVWGALFSR